MVDVSHAPWVSLWVSVEASKLKPPLWPSAQQAGGSWARTRQGRRCELAFLTHARPTSASEPFFCVFACVCVCFLSSPLWPALTPTRTHSLQHYTKHSCSLLLSITSIALECTSSFCFSLFFMIIHCDSLKNCEENKRQRMFGRHVVFLVSSRCRKKDKCLLVSVLRPPVVPRSP